MLCAKYQEVGLCGSREKCDRNYHVIKFAYFHNIQSRVKQEVDKPQIQKCITGSILHTDALCQISGSWPVWFQRKMWQKFFVTPTTKQDDARRQKWSLYVASAKAGRRHNNTMFTVNYNCFPCNASSSLTQHNHINKHVQLTTNC